MIPFFAVTLFSSALLLFWVQPMVAKMLLPLLGGTPMVWNTCMVFFQALLLAGYAYAHLLSTRCSVRAQVLVHSLLLGLNLAFLPTRLHAGDVSPWNSDPTLWLLRSLALMVGLPFFTLAATSPLLQVWFARTRHRWAGDPYFLYAASNAGSLLGLLAYPLLLEPHLRLAQQTWLWAGLYLVLALLVAASGVAALKSGARVRESDKPGEPASAATSLDNMVAGLTWRRRTTWMLWAFIPSGLMLAVTSYLATDIASVPLLWVVPLGLYLATLTLAFGPGVSIPTGLLTRLLPIAAVALVFLQLCEIRNPAWVLMVLHLGFFFTVALLFHTQLAHDRPPRRFLTEFYFCLSIGGVLGGAFNSLLAPLLFRTILEYPSLVVLACLTWSRQNNSPGETEAQGGRFPLREVGAFPDSDWFRQGWRLAWPALAIGLLAWLLARFIPNLNLDPRVRAVTVFGLPLLLSYLTSRHAVRFGLALAAVLLASSTFTAVHGHTLHAERNFFGALRVTQDPEKRFYRLFHGTTLHGLQFIAPERQAEPLAYFHRAGPCGQFMTAFNLRSNASQVAVIGLGAGSLAAYAQPNQKWTFYEIDPAVVRLAMNTNWFTYLQRPQLQSPRFLIGDARLRLREAAPHQFDLIIADAFGSDVPPLHLLTREALSLYLSKLAPDGLLLFQASSRYFDFRPVLGNLAAHFHLRAMAFYETEVSAAETSEGRCASFWIALAREDFGSWLKDHRWQPVPPSPKLRLWTDDYSSILDIFGWF